MKSRFKRQILFLFIIVSLTPALTVSALWYSFTHNSSNPAANFISIGQFVTPVALIGLAPAIALSIVFAELLLLPIRKIHAAITQISIGNLRYHIKFRRGGEFADMAQGLNDISAHLHRMLTEAASENELIGAERSKLRVVLDTMNNGVMALDADQRIILFNHAASRLSGQPLVAVAGQPQSSVLPFEQASQQVLNDWLKSPSDADEGRWQKVRLSRPDGQSRVVDLYATRLSQDPTGIKAIITFQDRTEEAELEEMKVDFVALAAHELRTPLTSVKGYLDLLEQDDAKLDADGQTYVRRSRTSADRLLALVNNLLNVAKIERGDLNYHLEPVEWSVYLAGVVDDFKVRIKEQRRPLSVNIPKRLPKITVDPLAIAEVVGNLLENAIVHTPPGTAVTITTRLTPDRKNIETVVSDNGPGIPPEAIPRLFTKFFRVGGLTAGPGTGLGLYISKSIVESHGGYTWVESKLNHGSEFGFVLPLKSAIAPKDKTGDNNDKAITKDTHGWIKAHSNR